MAISTIPINNKIKEMLSFIVGESELARRIRDHSWGATDLGELDTWPEALKTLVGIMLEANQPMFTIWGANQRLLYNDKYIDILQGHHPAALGRPILEVWSEIEADLRPLVEDAYRGLASHTDDIRLVMERNGYPEETHFAYSYTPVRRQGGVVEGFFCACVETTEQVKSLRAIRESEVRNRQIFDSAIDYAIIATDRDRRVTSWNKGATHILGWSEDEMLGEFVDRIFTDEDRAQDRPGVETRCALEQGRGNDERWHVRKSGERFFAAGEMTPLRNADGEAVGFVKVLRDRTQQRLDDEALARSGAELDAALGELSRLNETLEAQVAERTAERDRVWRLSRDLLGVADAEGRWISVNPAWLRVLGWRDDEIVGRTSEWLEHPDDRDRTRAEVAHLAAGYDTLAFENRFRHRDGGYRWLSWTAAPEAGLLYCAARDITAERERQIELAAAQDQLRQAQKVEAVGQLTGGVAHDFNNLLTVIRGSVDLLRRPNLSEDRRERYIEAIAETADRATKLTNQLLAFARRQALLPEMFDAEASVRSLLDMVQTLAGSRVQVEVETADCPCLIHADRNQFDTAIINMAVNARDAMGGEGTLTIRLAAVTGMPAVRAHPAVPGDFIAISLRDTGEGIPPDRIDHIFEPFFTTKDVGHGTGLGLSQVFGFAKQSGGEVMVESEAGQGATFTLYLPRFTGEHAAIAGDAASSEPEQDEGGCILVVEDNREVGEFARSALTELGYTIVLARDAAHALGELEVAVERFDVVFSDVVMPGMSGVQLGQEIRRLYPQLPVVLTSGYSDVLAQEGSHGFDLIHKPYSIEQLAQFLRRVMNGRRSRLG